MRQARCDLLLYGARHWPGDDETPKLLTDCISAIEERTINGDYTLTFTYPVDGARAKQIKVERLIMVRDNDHPSGFDDHSMQLFRIKDITVTANNIMDVYCEHISYDLKDVCILPYRNGYLHDSNKRIIGDCQFNLEFFDVYALTYVGDPDVMTVSDYIAKCCADHDLEYSFAVRGTEIRFSDHIGDPSAHHVIKYAVNAAEISRTESSTGVVTGVIAVWRGKDDFDRDYAKASDVYAGTSSTLDMYARQHTAIVDVSSYYDDPPTAQQLLYEASLAYPQLRSDIVGDSIEVDYVDVYDNPSFDIRLGDGVRIYLTDPYIIDTEYIDKRVIGYTYDALAARYISLQIGDHKRTINTAVERAAMSAEDRKKVDALKTVATSGSYKDIQDAWQLETISASVSVSANTTTSLTAPGGVNASGYIIFLGARGSSTNANIKCDPIYNASAPEGPHTMRITSATAQTVTGYWLHIYKKSKK